MRIYIVTYDIGADERRDKVFETLKSWGTHLQFSVFWCRLSPVQLVRLRNQLHLLVNHQEDQILFFCLGGDGDVAEANVSWLGKAFTPPQAGAVVI